MKQTLCTLVVSCLLFLSLFAANSAFGTPPQDEENPQTEIVQTAGDEAHHGEVAPLWSVFPFVILLVMIAAGPLFFEHFWHHNYPIVAVSLAAGVVLYYVFVLHNVHSPVHALAEYVQFIALISALYIASGGILIEVDRKGTPFVNSLLLLIGAVFSNVIGTTGASMLLIRPFMRLNKGRIRPYHVVFFIFTVSNVGGALTPIGDPPLFLGFLRGVPFTWTIGNSIEPWAFALMFLIVFFFLIDRYQQNKRIDRSEKKYTNKIRIEGKKNFLWLGLIIASVFLDPNVIDWVPAITYEGQKISFLREIIMFAAAFLSYKTANKESLSKNEFNFEPIREVAYIFIGIFGTMMPALELVASYAASDTGVKLISHNSLYWLTGSLSALLDNAPTYINFLTAAMAAQGANIADSMQVVAFASGDEMFSNSVIQLKAISISAVFFGAMTYIGNGPNFMVKSIAEQTGLQMPSFFGYLIRFSIPILLPVLFLVWLLFFANA